MSAKPKPRTDAAQQARASVIAGQSLAVVQSRPSHLLIRERHGSRFLQAAAITQLGYSKGMLDGPWFCRCDGQQFMLGVDRDTAQRVADAIGVKLEELEA